MDFIRIKEHSEETLGDGTDIREIEKLESLWGQSIPNEYRAFLIEVGYAEIFGDEIYSIYEVPDQTACLGLHWMNKDNENLKNGFIEFFSNDTDGTFYISATSGKVYINGTELEYADSFSSFLERILAD